MFTMKNLGHTLPGRQNWTFASNSWYYYFKKSYANHSVKQLSKFVKFAYINLYTKGPFSKLWFESWDTKLIHLHAWHTVAINAELRMHHCAGYSESLSHVVSTKISWNYVRSIEPVHTHCMHARIQNILSERTEMPLKIDHHRPISETPLKWRFAGVSMAHHWMLAW